MSKLLYIDVELFEKKLLESGIKIGFLCEQLGISRQGFDKKRKGLTPFRASEVFVVCTLLRISEDDRNKIFLPKGTH